MEVGHEIVPDFLIPLVKNAHPAQKYSIVERKKRSESVPRDGVFPQAASQAIERLKTLANETWGKPSEMGGMSVWVKDVSGSSAASKGELEMDINPTYFLAAALPSGARRVWDPNVDESKLLESTDPATTMAYMSTKSRFTFSSRDMTVVSRLDIQLDGTVHQAACSISHPSYPPTDSRVRAILDVAGMIIRPVPMGDKFGAHVTYLTRVDLKGWTTSTIVQYASTQTPQSVAKIRDFVKQHGAPPFSMRVSGLMTDNDFVHDKSTYMLEWIHDHPTAFSSHSEFFVPIERYRQGVDVTVSPAGSCVGSAYRYRGHGVEGYVIRLENWTLAKGALARIFIAPGRQGKDKITIDGSNVTVGPLTVAAADLELYASRDTSSEAAPATATVPSSQPDASAAPGGLAHAQGKMNAGSQWNTAHRHAAAEESLWSRARAVFAAGTSSWNDQGEYKGSRIYQKNIPGHSLGMLMGVRTVPNVTPYEMFSSLRYGPGRAVWEKELFDRCERLEVLSARTELVHVMLKGRFPASPRDSLFLESWNEESDGTLWFVATSVEDPKCPPTKAVRYTSELVLWVLKPFMNGSQPGVQATYISQSSPGGWVPDAVLRLVSQQIPQAIRYVETYMAEHGPPAFVTQMAGSYTGAPTYDAAKSGVTFSYRSEPTSEFPLTILALPTKRYGNGMDLDISPATAVIACEATSRSTFVGITAEQGVVVTVRLVAASTKRPALRRVLINGSPVQPTEASEATAALASPLASGEAAGPVVAASPSVASPVVSPPRTPEEVAAVIERLQARANALEAKLRVLQAAHPSSNTVATKPPKRSVVSWQTIAALLAAFFAAAWFRRH